MILVKNLEYKKGLVVPLDDTSKEPDDYSIYTLYKELYEGKAIEFDLCAGDKPCFDMKSNYSITTKTKFIRKLCF